MPRKAAPKPAFNDRPQPVEAPTGLPYGEHQAATAAQRELPVAGQAVDLAALFRSPTAAAPVTGAQGGETPQQLATSHAEALAAYNPVPIGLTGPTNRPFEPVTAGLASGAGPGPSSLQLPQSSAAATLYSLAQTTDDPIFWDLAEQAARNGQ